MKQYETLLKHVFENGKDKADRTGIGTRSLFGYQMLFALDEGFPLITSKKVHLKSIIHELLWFLRGDTNIKYLTDNGVTIWNAWADEKGELGPLYGYQWRSWPSNDGNSIDQITTVVNTLKNNPDSRRILVSDWKVTDIERMALPPCHVLFQYYVSDNRLSCQLYQRSADLFLGVPFNIASFALLTMMIAQVCNLELGDFIHTFGDVHIYRNHFEQVKLQLSRKVKKYPKMIINPTVSSIFDFKFQNFKLIGYDPYPAINATIAI